MTFFSIFAENEIRMREDKQMLVLLHLSQLVGGFIIPLVLWLTKKDEIKDMDLHGKAVINFQITTALYSIGVVILSFMCVGFLLLPFLILYVTICPVINAINASNGLSPKYPGTIVFIQ